MVSIQYPSILKYWIRSQYGGKGAKLPADMVFVVGGWGAEHQGGPTDVIETWDIRANRWAMPHIQAMCKRAYHKTVYLDNKIYLIGGRASHKNVDS